MISVYLEKMSKIGRCDTTRYETVTNQFHNQQKRNQQKHNQQKHNQQKHNKTTTVIKQQPMKQRSERQSRTLTLGDDDESLPESSTQMVETSSRATVERSLAEMQRIEDEIAFLQDAIEEIKSLTEYHVLPIAEHLTPETLRQFIETAKTL